MMWCLHQCPYNHLARGNDMADIGKITVPVVIKIESVEDSEGLRSLLRDLIQQELANLSPESVQVLTDQIVNQYETRD